MPARRKLTVLLLVAVVLGATARGVARGQKYESFTTRTPLGPGETLVLGFQGGRERWDNEKTAVRRLALRLRERKRKGLHVETVENRKRALALRLIREAFDRNGDGTLDAEERSNVRLVLYGHSFGGAAVVKLARELEAMDVPVLLMVQIDSVGRGDDVVPPNVARAANFFQRNGFLIRGEPTIRAADPKRTKILGNFQFDYSKKRIDLSQASWWKRMGREAHTKMEHDPEVWAKVEELILAEIPPGSESAPGTQ